MHDLISALFPLALMILLDVIVRALWSPNKAPKTKNSDEPKDDVVLSDSEEVVSEVKPPEQQTGDNDEFTGQLGGRTGDPED